jgi:biopolymer transport protein ExbD
MALQVGSESGADDVMMEMNTTPLIDVMLVLLILLMLTLPIQPHAVKLDVPRLGPQSNPIVVHLGIDFDGTLRWNGDAVVSRKTLNWYFASIGRKADQPEIHLQPDRLVRYDTVARTLADAHRLGVKKIGFIGTDEYRQ